MASLPKRIGRYEILRELGRGMMGVVYEAHDPALTRTVALKTINLAFAATPEERDAFERRFATEARIAGRLSHPGIVVVHDVGRDEATGTVFIALERLPGETLAHMLQRGETLGWREALDVARQVAEALQHAHGQGVVHRDVKPANVMLLPSGQAKIMDFGIAKLETAQLTAAGQFFGTPLYMSPEQALSKRVDARGDIFSLGAVLYALLTRQHAFSADTVGGILHRVVGEHPPRPSTLVPELPAEVDYVVARCLAKAPHDRYADAGLLAEDLGDVLAGRAPRHQEGWVPPEPPGLATGDPALLAGLAPPAPSPPTLTVDPSLERLVGTPLPRLPPAVRRGRRWRRAGAVLAVLVLGAIAGFVLSRAGLPESVGSRLAALGVPGLGPAAGATPEAPSPAPTLEPPTLAAMPAPASEPPLAPPPAPTAAAPRPAASPPGGELPQPTAEEREPPAAVPTRSRAPVVVPEPTPVPARIVIDFRHPLKQGTLRVFVDEEKVVGQAVRGDVTKNLFVAKLRGGVTTDVLELEPGRHSFRVEVVWDDEARSETINGRFLAGETYRLEVRLSRLGKALTLGWTR